MERQHVLGVHGIRQGRTSQRELTKDWTEALERGVGGLRSTADSQDRPPAVPAVEVPHWTALLAQKTGSLSGGDLVPTDLTPFTADEEAFVSQALDDLLTSEERAYAARTDPTTLGLPKLWPASVTRIAMAYDRRKPGGAVAKLIGALREVHLYLTRSDLAAQVRAHVTEAASEHTSVLIGHSLGSVIAYDLIRRGEIAAPGAAGAALHTFVTCGSPLAIPTVRRGLAVPDGEAMALPPHIRWVNVFDPGDVITGGAGLAAAAPAVLDVHVDNGRIDPHAATRYLRTVPVARAVTGTWT
ncbi:endopeptidase [Streptomyces rubellomurinus]|uniref:Endopeptidase n=1 Tax=Streptomyces rubellomurinus (strain ATCC 31215) TaxID=359131 RepID=A0A0F2TKV6_STRR3|nr:endopeptidase [Streptomyces rubellomurinus]